MFGQVFRIGIILPLHQVHRLSVGAEIVAAPNEIGHGFGHLPVRETEAKASAGVDFHEVLFLIVQINLARGSSGDEQQRFGGRRAGKLIQLPSQITGSVAGAAADDRQRRRMSLCQSLDPLGST